MLRRIWRNMRSRCRNSPYYKGVVICPEWQEFDNFAKWAGENGYVEGLSLDRRKNHLGYNPSNCRWVTPRFQRQHRRLGTCRLDYSALDSLTGDL